MNVILRGLLAGAAATVPMTYAMGKLHNNLPKEQNKTLPPRIITSEVAKQLGVWNNLDESEKKLLTLGTHFMFGATAGAAYSVLASIFPRLKSSAGGVGFGTAVWAGSYMGWIPAFNIMKSATKQDVERNIMMIFAHLVWGKALADFNNQFEDKSLDIPSLAKTVLKAVA